MKWRFSYLPMNIVVADEEGALILADFEWAVQDK